MLSSTPRRRCQLNSNVRPHKMQLLAKSSRFVIAAKDARGDNVTEPRPSACADRASVVKTHASTSVALTSFGVRGKGSLLPTAASPISKLSNGAGRPSCGGRRNRRLAHPRHDQGRSHHCGCCGRLRRRRRTRTCSGVPGTYFIASRATASVLRQPMRGIAQHMLVPKTRELHRASLGAA